MKEPAMFIFEKAPFASCHASTVVEVEAGQLLAAWFGGKDEGANDVKIWSARYDGKAWTAPEVAAEEPGTPCWNPVLFRTAKALWLWYKAGTNPMSWTGFVRRSTDNGKTWDKAEQLTAGLLGPIKNKPIQLGDGTLLAGTSVESYKAWAGWAERSTDGGKTWKRHGPIAVPDKPHGLIQPTLFERKDKTVVALCRSRGLGFICQAESTDGGQTWSEAKPTELLNPNSGFDGVRAANGDWYLAYNDSKLARTPLNLARSTDEGKTWQAVTKFEDELGEFSYPAIIQAQDGILHVTYTWNRRHIKHVTWDPSKEK
jgi:predicted neuraminidase